MRTGIFGGTFNPIHLAHLRIAEEARDIYRLDRVLFIPAAAPPHKPLAGQISFADRLAMVERAVADNAAFSTSDIEGKRGGASYSVDTLRELHCLYPHDDFFFIMGSDSFIEMETWREFRTIFSLTNIIVVERPGRDGLSLRTVVPAGMEKEFETQDDRTLLHRPSNHAVHYLTGIPLDISSSSIRSLAGFGRSVRYLVPDGVAHYIEEHELYAKEN